MPRARSLRSLAIAPTRRAASAGPPSPTFSDATNASAMNFGPNGPDKIITRANLRASMNAYEELVNSSANYRAALLTMSKVTAAFADAIETCSGLKGPSYEAGTRLQAASGLHHLIGNHWHVLAETLDRSFEKPLRQHLETYRTIVTERSASYEKALYERSQVIRQTEMSNLNKRQRNLQSFREALTVLQRQVDELDEMKAQHYQEIMEHEEEVWDVVQAKVCLTVRSTMDVFDRFTAKASDPVIEPMLQSIPDPFDSYGPPQAEDQIFSILQPLSISVNAPSPSPSPMNASPRETAKLDENATSKNAWLPSHEVPFPTTEGVSQWTDVPSPSSTPPVSSTPPRSTSPPASTVKRRQSHPPSSVHQPWKSGSKLKSVLPVVDESMARHADHGDFTSTDTTSSPSALNGNTQVPDTSWGSFSYGKSPYEAFSGSADTTPQHSRHPSLYSQPSVPAFDPDPPRSQTPQSDHAAHVPLPT